MKSQYDARERSTAPAAQEPVRSRSTIFFTLPTWTRIVRRSQPATAARPAPVRARLTDLFPLRRNLRVFGFVSFVNAGESKVEDVPSTRTRAARRCLPLGTLTLSLTRRPLARSESWLGATTENAVRAFAGLWGFTDGPVPASASELTAIAPTRAIAMAIPAMREVPLISLLFPCSPGPPRRATPADLADPIRGSGGRCRSVRG